MFEAIKQWNEVRGLLSKGFDHSLEVRLLREEDTERYRGIIENEIYEEVDALDDLIVVASGSIYKLDTNPHGFQSDIYAESLVEITPTITRFSETKDGVKQVILLNHLIYLCVQRLTHLGYNYQKTMAETQKEINSRVGQIIDGKFTKDKSPEAIANWYKANYDDCLL